ncbi:MAG: NADH-quinone oxidoreductase subunit J [Alphaproteobacteria bacterium]
MIFEAIAFYVFAAVTVVSAVMVISSRNPVHSVLFLISAFFNSAALFILMGAEFLALILVVVYVGAVAVLFLFVVMMLDIDFQELRRGFVRYLPVGALIGAVLLAELVLVGIAWTTAPRPAGGRTGPVAEAGVSNTAALGQVLYTDYIYLFQAAGLILLVAMIGAIVLTLRKREGVKRQDAGRQVGRRREDSVEVVEVETGQGI